MKLHRNLVFATIDSLHLIFNENKQADKVLKNTLKRDKRWGARDRGFIAETTYDIVRWKRLYSKIAEVKEPFNRANLFRLFTVWATLKGIQIPENLVPLAIDEFPVIFIAASCAKGETLLTGAKELRVKESDRIQVMADGLSSLGIINEVLEDGIRIEGGEFKEQNALIESHHDHRISMAFAIASVKSSSDITIEGVDNVKTSFPNFVELANSIGMSITQSA